jgi:hypothetical protein
LCRNLKAANLTAVVGLVLNVYKVDFIRLSSKLLITNKKKKHIKR